MRDKLGPNVSASVDQLGEITEYFDELLESCTMTFGVLDYEDFFNITNSFLYALIDKPQYRKGECQDCQYIANAIGSIQEGIVGIETSRQMWIDRELIEQLDFWPMVGRLLFLYLMNVQVWINIDMIFDHPALLNIQQSFVNRLDSRDQTQLIDHVFKNWYITQIILSDIPGRSCS